MTEPHRRATQWAAIPPPERDRSPSIVPPLFLVHVQRALSLDTENRMRLIALATTSLLSLTIAACGDDPAAPAAAPDAGSDAMASADADTAPDAVEQPLLVPEFGRDETRTIVGVASAADGLSRPLDLEFNPESPGDLWIASQGTDGITILFNAGTESQLNDTFLDAFRNHFLEAVSSIAFGANGTWGSCQESRNTYDGQAPPNDFMGPALWPSDLNVFAAVFQDPFGSDLGSHLDMLHASPLCMGMAHYQANEYFVFDGLAGHMVYYDFAQDHGPGQDDHSDGVIRRFPEVSLTRVEGVPGHMEYHAASNRVFMADTGAGRVVTYTVGTGTMTRELPLINEPLAEYSEYSGAEVEVFAGDLQMPSGLAIHENRVFVGDYATGIIHAYDVSTGEKLAELDSGSEELTGIEIGPEGTLWFIDSAFMEVLRVLP